jgi:hypothetical protein
MRTTESIKRVTVSVPATFFLFYAKRVGAPLGLRRTSGNKKKS